MQLTCKLKNNKLTQHQKMHIKNLNFHLAKYFNSMHKNLINFLNG
jgi:hypothetical protein